MVLIDPRGIGALWGGGTVSFEPSIIYDLQDAESVTATVEVMMVGDKYLAENNTSQYIHWHDRPGDF